MRGSGRMVAAVPAGFGDFDFRPESWPAAAGTGFCFKKAAIPAPVANGADHA